MGRKPNPRLVLVADNTDAQRVVSLELNKDTAEIEFWYRDKKVDTFVLAISVVNVETVVKHLRQLTRRWEKNARQTARPVADGRKEEVA